MRSAKSRRLPGQKAQMGEQGQADGTQEHADAESLCVFDKGMVDALAIDLDDLEG